MKRIGVDQVARALVRLGIVLVTISVIVMVLQVTPLLAQTSSVICTSATGLPYDPGSSPGGSAGTSNVVFDYNTQACIIGSSGAFLNLGSMRFQLNEIGGGHASGHVIVQVSPGVNTERNQISDLESFIIPGGTINATQCRADGSTMASGDYSISSNAGGELVTLTVSVTVSSASDVLINSAIIVIG